MARARPFSSPDLHQYTRHLLLQVLVQPEGEVLPRLSNRQAAELLYEQQATPAPTVTFKHVLTQEVAYHSRSQGRKRALHERTAQAIEGLCGDQLAERYGEQAYHYRCSSNTQQVIGYLQRAGQQASNRSAYQEAIKHLTQALEPLQSLLESPTRTQRDQQDFLTREVRGTVLRGWALATLGLHSEGIARRRPGDGGPSIDGSGDAPVWSGLVGRGIRQNRTDNRGAVLAGRSAGVMGSDGFNCEPHRAPCS